MNDHVGQHIGNYLVLRLLGRGGFADVYLGEHAYLKSQAALKVLRLQLGEQETASFLQEGQILARLVHPHIVRVLDFSVQDGIPFLVMEYAPHGSLRQRHPTGSRLPLETIVAYVHQVASALQYIHDQRLIHRDVKPENMLLGSHDEVLLSDFGLVMLTPQTLPSGATEPMEQSLAGTTPYLAPEQLRGKAHPASDQYALGVVVYEWLCGKPPFRGPFLEVAVQHVSVPPPPLREQIPDLSPAIEEVVLRALAKERELRFASVQDFATALEHASQEALSPRLTPMLAPEHLVETGHRPSSMRQLPTGTVTLLFTDMEGSTRLLQQLGDRYASVLSECRHLLRAAFQRWSGHEVDTQGDAFFVTFARATDAVSAAVDAQRALASHRWPEGTKIGMRMGLHTGEPSLTSEGYIGLDVHRAARIMSAGHGGQVLLSQTTCNLVEQDLPDEVSLRDLGEHRLKDLERPHRLFQLVIADMPADFPALKTLDISPNNLPIQPTPFIGREQEMAEVKRVLAHHRLVTLTGPGGCGKTRLALKVAADLVEQLESPVWLVELAALTDPALVPQTVARTLGLREQAEHPWTQTLVDFLQSRRALLMLDNCEHLVAACAALAHTLLRTCPDLRILATSREALGIDGEVTWLVPSLSLPGPYSSRHLLPLERLAQYDAIRLFVVRVTDVVSTFTLTPQNAPAVTLICQRLDGIPLAIELAAARAKVLSFEQIVARLDNAFRLLTSGSRMALPRQQTLQATIDWSYNLLSQNERVLFRRLSVFAGGFTLQAVEVVCAGEGLAQDEMLELLSSLVTKSLVVVIEYAEEARYQLLETVRQYAREKLQAAGEEMITRRRHTLFFVHLAEEANPEIRSANRDVWLQWLEKEHDNLRAALGWLRGSAEIESREMGLHLAGSLGWFWYFRGYISEARQWLEGMLALTAAIGNTQARAEALFGAGALAWIQGDYAMAHARLDEGVVLWRALANRHGLAYSLTLLGLVTGLQGDHDLACSLQEESLVLFRGIGDKWGLALALYWLGDTMRTQRDYVSSLPLYEESLTLFREMGDRWGIALPLQGLGAVAYRQGDYTAACSRLEECLMLRRQVGDRWLIAQTLSTLGVVLQHQGDHERATQFFEESLVLYRDLGDTLGIAFTSAHLPSTEVVSHREEVPSLIPEQSVSVGEKGSVSIAKGLEKY